MTAEETVMKKPALWFVAFLLLSPVGATARPLPCLGAAGAVLGRLLKLPCGPQFEPELTPRPPASATSAADMIPERGDDTQQSTRRPEAGAGWSAGTASGGSWPAPRPAAP